MKRILILTILTVQCACVFSQTNEIFGQIVDDYVLKLRPPTFDESSQAIVTILSKPSYSFDLEPNDFERFKEQYRRLDKRTFFNFIDKMNKELEFDKPMVAGVEFRIMEDITPKMVADLIRSNENWIPSIVEFSNIGFNDGRDQALVYYGFNSGPGVCGGIYIVYERKGKKWKKRKSIPAWAC